jgi:hypothetical protein
VKKPLRFHEDALAEFASEAGYCAAKSIGLGEKFTNEVEAATEIAREFPVMAALQRPQTGAHRTALHQSTEV